MVVGEHDRRGAVAHADLAEDAAVGLHRPDVPITCRTVAWVSVSDIVLGTEPSTPTAGGLTRQDRRDPSIIRSKVVVVFQLRIVMLW